MIKLRKPLQTRQKNILNKGYEKFGQKLTANYDYMAMTMNPEELLHMVSTPPEVYLMEQGANSLKSNNLTWNNNQTRVTMINNMINRLMVAPDVNITYQDRVFIESILRKTGITDVSQFITRVRSMQEQISRDEELVNYYVSQGDEFKTLLNVTKAEREEARAAEKRNLREEPSERLFLQEKVYDRLMTTEILESLQELYTDHAATGTVINNYEAAVTEWKGMAESIYLKETEKLLFGDVRSTERVYINPYEVGESVTDESAIHEQVVKELTGAVLYETILNLYRMRYTEIKEGQDNWYDYSSNMGVNLENNVVRYENFHNSETTFLMNAPVVEEEELPAETPVREETPTPPVEMNHYSTIEEMIEYYDKRNTELYNQVVKINEQTPVPERLKIDRQKARRDALRALQDPEGVKREYAEEHTRLEHLRQTRETAYESLMTSETKEIFNILKAMQNGEPVPDGVSVHRNAEMLLNAQAEQIRQHNEQIPVSEIAEQFVRDKRYRSETTELETEELIHRNENLQNITEQTVENMNRTTENVVNEASQIKNEIIRNVTDTRSETFGRNDINEISEELVHKTAITRNITEDVSKSIHDNVREVIDRQTAAPQTVTQPGMSAAELSSADMVFKREQRTLTEDSLNEILNYREENRERVEKVTNTETINENETNVREINTTVTQTNETNVSEIVNNRLRQEMATISDQVYRNIEQRLNLERSRRGY